MSVSVSVSVLCLCLCSKLLSPLKRVLGSLKPAEPEDEVARVSRDGAVEANVVNAKDDQVVCVHVIATCKRGAGSISREER